MAGGLDKELPVPLYHQLQGVLKAEIEAGKWRADDQLPNESKLAERFGVSKITVRQALQELADMGYIRREHGRGTFISRRKFEEGSRDLTSFTEQMKGRSMKVASRVLHQAIDEADGPVAEALKIAAGSSVFVLRRVRLANGEPVTVQTAHIPADLVPGLEMTGECSLYDLLQAHYGLYAARAKETYFAGVADARTAKLLKISTGAPVFKAERITLTPNDRPFEFVQSTIRGDRYSIVLDLVKHGADKRVLEYETRSRSGA